jgi:hypothetical protein
VESGAHLVHVVFTNRGKSLATYGVMEAQTANQVDTVFDSDGSEVARCVSKRATDADPSTHRRALFALVELVAVDGVVEEVREVREEVECGIRRVDFDVLDGDGAGMPITAGEAVALAGPTVVGLKVAQARDQPRRNGSLRDLVCRPPLLRYPIPVTDQRLLAAEPVYRATPENRRTSWEIVNGPS